MGSTTPADSDRSPRAQTRSEEHRWILDDLRATGYRKVSDVYNFATRFDGELEAAVPVLISWLGRARFTFRGVVSALAGPHGRPAARALLSHFETVRPKDRDIIGYALYEMADPSISFLLSEMAELARRDEFGDDRWHLVAAIGRLGTDEAAAVASTFIGDRQLTHPALLGLKRAGRSVPEGLLVQAERVIGGDRDSQKLISALRKRNERLAAAKTSSVPSQATANWPAAEIQLGERRVRVAVGGWSPGQEINERDPDWWIEEANVDLAIATGDRTDEVTSSVNGPRLAEFAGGLRHAASERPKRRNPALERFRLTEETSVTLEFVGAKESSGWEVAFAYETESPKPLPIPVTADEVERFATVLWGLVRHYSEP